jgi:hypothetical protein
MKLIIIIGSSRIRSGLDDDARERPLLAWMCAVRGAYGRSAAICQSCIHAESTGSSGGLACQAGLGERIEMGAMWLGTQRCVSICWFGSYPDSKADLLPRLLTRHPSNRLSLASLPSHPFFSSLAISTLNFLDPTTFASKPREEKATFLRGLVRVLSTFSDRLRKGKVLPSLLEEVSVTVK